MTCMFNQVMTRRIATAMGTASRINVRGFCKVIGSSEHSKYCCHLTNKAAKTLRMEILGQGDQARP